MKKWLKYVLGILAFITVISVVGIRQLTYAPTPAAELAAQKAVTENYVSIFEAEQDDSPAIVLYQGGFVEQNAYAPLASQLAEAGFTVYLIDTPLNLPVLAEQRGLAVVEDYQLTDVIFMGHSLGGVIAANNAAALVDSGKVAGLVLLASYLAGSTDLSEVDFPVLSVTASEDKVLNWEAFEAATKLLPADTIYDEIEGGNHSGFGDYGLQEKDGQAAISSAEQREQIVDLVIKNFPS